VSREAYKQGREETGRPGALATGAEAEHQTWAYLTALILIVMN